MARDATAPFPNASPCSFAVALISNVLGPEASFFNVALSSRPDGALRAFLSEMCSNNTGNATERRATPDTNGGLEARS
jgi:hypothetical protein